MNSITHLIAATICLLSIIANSFAQTPDVESLLDSSFTPNVEGMVSAFAVQPDDKLVIVTQPENSDSFVTRLNPNGTIDPSFRVYAIPRNTAFIYSSVVTLQADGKILITGPECLNGVCEAFSAAFIARLNADGTVDATFQRGLISAKTNECRPFVSVIASTEQGIYVAGTFTEFNGVNRNAVVRLNRDGTLDPTFEYHLTPKLAAPAACK